MENARLKIRYPGPLALLLAWTLIGTLSYSRHFLEDHSVSAPPSIAFEFCYWLTCFYPWIALAPLVFWLERRYPLGGPKWLRNVALLLLVGAPLSYLGALSAIALAVALNFVFRQPLAIPSSWLMQPVREMWIQILIYLAVVGAGYMIRTMIQLRQREQEAAELALQKSQLEASLRQAELENLRTRLNPHFLFNCLQNISVLTQDDPAAAKQMLARLGDLLRTALRGGSAAETVLKTEVALTRSYVAVEKVRFGDRLSVLFDIAPETEAALVPTFLLQPLVENAIVHGLREVQRGGIISVRSAIDAGSLVLTVTDNGIGPPATNSATLETGIGLDSTCERLARMYPQQHSFSMRPLPEGGTEVRIAIPLRFDNAPTGVAADEQVALVDRR